MRARRPPAVASWLLRWLCRSPDARYLAGDLAEGFFRRAGADEQSARRWYWSQVLGAIRHAGVRPARPRSGEGSNGPEHRRRWRAAVGDFFAARHVITRRPRSAALAVITIAVAVTAVSTMAAVSYAVLVRPLPWPAADRLVRVWETREGGAATTGRITTTASFQVWADALPGHGVVEALTAYVEEAYTVQGPEGAERIAGVATTPSLFTMFGARPVAGRVLVAGDTNAAVVSETYATQHFGSAKDWVGRSVTIDGRPFDVVGVLPAAFDVPAASTALWLPLTVPLLPDIELVTVVARVTPGTTPEQAAIAFGVQARQAPPLPPTLQSLVFGAAGAPRLHAESLLDSQTREVRPALIASLAGMALLLATAVVSLAGLQLARASERRQELAIRSAIGAGRLRLMTLLMSEAVWLSMAGGAVSVALTGLALRVAPRVLPPGFPRVEDLAFNATSVLMVGVIAAVTGVLIGLLPAWRASRPATIGDGRTIHAGWHRLLTTTQIALAVVLLVAAGLVGRTLLAWVHEDLGYAPGNLVLARLIGTPGEQAARVDADTLGRVMTSLGRLPGVSGVALSTALPFQAGSGRADLGFSLPAPDGSGRQVAVRASQSEVTPSYFRLVGMRLAAGRFLEDSDVGKPTPPMVVNQAFARAYLGDRPLGPFALGGEVVGVVEDIKDRGPAGPVDPQLFFLYDMTAGASLQRPVHVVIQASADPDTVSTEARTVVAGVDRRLGLGDLSTVRARLEAMAARPRLYAGVAIGSALLALLVAAVGLFSVLWHGVSSRTREIGVRLAVGATPRRILRQILAEGLAVAGAGTAIGAVAAAAVVRSLSGLLYRVAPYDAVAFTLAPALLLVVALVACLIPARQAARVDPVETLRGQ